MIVKRAVACAGRRRVRACLHQILMVILINVPTISFGLAMGWVSLASGESAGDGTDGSAIGRDASVVAASAITFAASLLGVPLAARALSAGRKLAIIATSAAFVMCEESVRGAAVSALVLANNLGVLLIFLAADAHIPHRTVLWSCLCLSAVHCVLFLFVPESPPYLAANGKADEARAALAWLRGVSRDDPSLDAEVLALPEPDQNLVSPFKLAKDMLRCPRRRRAFVLVLVAVVGQEACGVLALLQFAERVFVLARDDVSAGDGTSALGTPARHAVFLGGAQLVASVLALYLVERVGRKRLMVWSGLVTGACLACGAGAIWSGTGGAYAGVALAGAVFADSAGLQPAPYAMLADMFTYQYRGCAATLVSLAAWLGNACEVVVFPLVAQAGGLRAALALAAALTLALAAFAALCLPETRNRTPLQIYDVISPEARLDRPDCCSKETVCTQI